MSDLKTLSAEWIAAKEAERSATDQRRAVEDQIKSLVRFSEASEGTSTINPDGGFCIKISGRIDRKIDAQMLQEIAAEHGITEHLSTLFRWNPSINTKAWRDCDESITSQLAQAITAKPGRPTFKITTED